MQTFDKTEKEITENWRQEAKPMVSICCLAYNHEDYISQTLDGFLMQETRFPFEIVIGEDCSSDNTREVIRQYQDKFPNLIRVIESSANVGMQENFFRAHAACKSPYIAYCEGDDYWADPHKLAIQVEFLEQNPEYVLSGTDAIIIDEKDNLLHKSNLSYISGKNITENSKIKDNLTLTMSAVYRNIIADCPAEMKQVVNMDTFMQTLLLQHGKRKFHDDIKKCVYRVHDGGVWSSLNQKEKDKSSLNTYIWLYKYYARTGQITKKLKQLKTIIIFFLRSKLKI